MQHYKSLLAYIASQKSNFPKIDKKSTQVSTTAGSVGTALQEENSHNNDIIKEAFSNFSRSIAYAEPNSEELALGYTNRALLLHHIKKYDLALTDIEAALKTTKCSSLKSKLLINKISCHKALNEKVGDSVIKEVNQLIRSLESNEMREKFSESLKSALDVEVDVNFRRVVSNTISEMTRSKEMPCASDAIEIKYDETFGRHLTVNRRIPPGDILMIEDVYAAFPSREERYLICTNCLDFTLNGIPCDYCPCAIFCSKSCKDIAWERYHKIECDILRDLINRSEGEVDDAFFLYLRSVIIALNEKNLDAFDFEHVLNENDDVERNSDKRSRGFFNGQFLNNKFRCFCSLEDHKDEMDRAATLDVENLALSVAMILECDKKGQFEELKKIMEKMNRILMINTFTCQELDGMSVFKHILDAYGMKEKNIFGNITARGKVSAICSSLINHSCASNVSRVFKNGKIIIYSTRPIQKNEQLFVNYSPFDMETNKLKRQLHLKRNFFFDCNCLPCKEDLIVKFDRQTFSNLKESFREQLFKDGTLNVKKLKSVIRGNCSNDFYDELKQLLLEFLKSELNEIFRGESLEGIAVKKGWMGEKIFKNIFSEIYSLRLVMEKCC